MAPGEGPRKEPECTDGDLAEAHGARGEARAGQVINVLGEYWKTLYLGTEAEIALEPHIAALAVPYRTQFPYFLYLGGIRFFPDFLLPTLGIVVEVDDDSHNTPEKQKEDAARSDILSKHGWRVVRCTNAEALRTPEVVIDRIRALQPVNVGLPKYKPRSERRKRRRRK